LAIFANNAILSTIIREREAIMKKKASTINVSITPQLEEWIDEQIASGWYNNTSEVVREGLRLLRIEQEVRTAKLKDLRAAIDEGMNSPAAPWEGAEAIKRVAREKHATKFGKPVAQE
jgi:antitoxin ParD1/3/4